MLRQNRRATTLAILAILAVAALGLSVGGVTAADGGEKINATNYQATAFEHTETGVTHTFQGQVQASEVELPPGEYNVYYQGTDQSVFTNRIQVSNDVETQNTYEVGVVTDKEDDSLVSYSQNGKVGIWVGITDSSTEPAEPVANEEITIEIRDPNYELVDTFERTTDQNGVVHITHDLNNAAKGEYQIEATGSDADGYGSFSVGSGEALFPGMGDVVHLGEEIRLAGVVAQDRKPVPNAERNLEVSGPDGEQTIPVTTNSDGIATETLTFEEAGTYSVNFGDSFESFDVSEITSSVYTNGDRLNSNVQTGETVKIHGQAQTAEGAAANKELRLAIYNDRDDAYAENISVVTNNVGQYASSWTAPNSEGSFEVHVYTDTGERVANKQANIYVQVPDNDEPQDLDADVDFEGDFDDPIIPGTETTVTATVTDSSGEPVSNADVSLLLSYGYDTVPVDRTSLTTNADGEATYTTAVPEEAPKSELHADIVATDGEAQTTASAQRQVQNFRVETSIEPRSYVAPDEETTFQLNATDPVTGEGVSGLPLIVLTESGSYHSSVADSGSTTTDTDGTAELTVDAPMASGNFHWGDIYPYRSTSTYPLGYFSSFDVGIEGVEDSYEAGETIDVSYTADHSSDTNARIVVSTYEDVADPITTAEIVEEGETVSTRIPEDHPDAIYQIQVLTSDGDGVTSYTEEWVNIEGSEEDTVQVGLENAEGAPGENVGIDLTTTANDVAGYQAGVTYDSDTVQLTSVEGVDLADPVTNVDNEAGTATITASQASGTDSPTLAHLSFELTGDAGTQSSLSLKGDGTTMSDSQGESVAIDTYNDGSISIVDKNPTFDGTVSIESASAASGESTTVNVTSEAPNVTDYTTTISYDPNVVELETVGSGDFDDVTTDIDNEAGVVTLDAAATDGMDDPRLAELTYSVVGEDGETSDISFNETATSLEHAQYEIEVQEYDAGSVTVVNTDDVTFSVSNETGGVGGTVTAEVAVNADNVAGYQTNLTFDPAVVEVESVDGAAFGAPTTNINNDEGWVFFTQSAASGTDAPTLATVTFIITGEAGDQTLVEPVAEDTNVNDANGGPVSIDVYKSGSIDVAEEGIVLDNISVETNIEGEAAQGETITANATVLNTGQETTSTTVEYVFDGEVLGERTVELDAGGETTVTVTGEVPLNQETGTVSHGVVVENSEITKEIEVFELGDYNHDGSVSSIDSTLLQRGVVGLPVEQEVNPAAGDLTQDERITSADVTQIQRKIIGLLEL